MPETFHKYTYVNSRIAETAAILKEAAADWQPARRRTAPARWLYVIGDDAGLVKIGVTNDIPRRLQAMRCASGRPDLRVIYRANCDDRARTVERDLHRRLHGLRVFGEWFEVDADTAISLAQLVTRLHGVG